MVRVFLFPQWQKCTDNQPPLPFLFFFCKCWAIRLQQSPLWERCQSVIPISAAGMSVFDLLCVPVENCLHDSLRHRLTSALTPRRVCDGTLGRFLGLGLNFDAPFARIWTPTCLQGCSPWQLKVLRLNQCTLWHCYYYFFTLCPLSNSASCLFVFKKERKRFGKMRRDLCSHKMF